MHEPLDRVEPGTAVPVSGDESPGLWTLFRQAIRGTQMDYTKAPIGRAIFMLAIPMVMEMAMESIFVIADIFWVSHLGADATATVGLTESMLTCIYAVAMGVSIGATALVARRIGEGNPEGASRAAMQSIILMLLLSAAIGTAGYIYADQLLALMGAPPSVIETGSSFTRVMLTGNATVMLLFLINAIFRGAGDAAIAMRVLWFGNILNIVLGPLFIFGIGPFPELGVTGAAVATNIGRGSAVLYQVYTLLSGKSRITIHPRHFALDFGLIGRVLRLSGTGTLQILISTASYVGVVRIVSGFGADAVAGYTIGIRLIIFALLPSFGVSSAAATMVGQNLGANQPERAEEAVWKAAYYNMLFLGGLGLIFLIFADPLIGIFTQEPAVHAYGVTALRVISCGFVFYAYGMVLSQSFNGAGDTWTPTWINLFAFWLVELPLAWVLARPLGLGPLGVFIALAVAFSTMAFVSAVLFKRGRWKTKKI